MVKKIMREFIYYSKNAVTSSKLIKEDLMKSGRIDIVCDIIKNSFFYSHNAREDVKLHLIFGGAPDQPKHIEIHPYKFSVKSKNNIDMSQRDIANLIGKILDGYSKEQKKEVLPNIFIEKKSLRNLIEELEEDGKEIILLDKKGEFIRKAKILNNSVFIFGDQDGFPKYELKYLRQKKIRRINLGPKMYFAIQSLIILQNELDIR
jgi:tRNA (pseudouridine54-N1)-methyltransferase